MSLFHGQENSPRSLGRTESGLWLTKIVLCCVVFVGPFTLLLDSQVFSTTPDLDPSPSRDLPRSLSLPEAVMQALQTNLDITVSRQFKQFSVQFCLHLAIQAERDPAAASKFRERCEQDAHPHCTEECHHRVSPLFRHGSHSHRNSGADVLGTRVCQ